MSGKGRMKYVPPKVLKELNNIKINYEIDNDADAFKKMAEFVPVGIEIDKNWFNIFKKRKK